MVAAATLTLPYRPAPGDIVPAARAEEYISPDQLYRATEIILTLLKDCAGRVIIECPGKH